MPRWLVIVLAVIGALTLTCGGALVVGVFWIVSNSRPPEGITVSVIQPPEIRIGDTFDVVITVTDSLGQARTIRDVDFYDPLLDGVSVVKVDPPYSGYDSALGSATFTMEAPIDASATTTLIFTFKAERAGTYSGDLDVGVDKVMRIQTTPHSIVIGEKR
jgi:hypothetical protein